MRKPFLVAVVAICMMLTLLAGPAAAATSTSQACWGQATRVFAQMGEMGGHASSFESPRLGLRNLARALADAGALPDDSMQALGAFVAAELGLSIAACE